MHVDASAVDDVVQDTWMGVLHGLANFEGRASFKTWLFRILVNRARTRAVRNVGSHCGVTNHARSQRHTDGRTTTTSNANP
jgi:DNA-directed RNA polymerase specialized sigma24 family protein